MSLLKKLFSPISLSISFFFLFYTFYKDQIIFKGEEKDYYLIYYIVSISLILFSTLTFYLNEKIKNYMIFTIIFISVTLYSIEAYITLTKLQLLTTKKNPKTSLQVYQEIIKKNKNSNYSVAVWPTSHFGQKKIFPLSGISKSKTIFCRENGYQAIYESDRYGFNNPDEEWDKNEIEYLLIGDSYTHGACVNRPNDIASVLRTLSNKSALTLGMYDNSSLIEYASLKEYLNSNVKKIVWIYFGNDMRDLIYELDDKLLIKYLKDLNFNQNLKIKQDEIDSQVRKVIELKIKKSGIKKLQSQKINEENSKITFHLLNFLKIYELRRYFFSINEQKKTLEQLKINEKKTKKSFVKILKLAKDLSLKNNSKFYFVYLPGYIHYNTHYKSLNYNTYYEFVKKTANELNIPFIDLHEEFLGKEVDPNIFSSFEFGHYNEMGYKKIAETIYKFTQD